MTEQDKSAYLTKSEINQLVTDTVNQTLTQLGIEHDDPIEMQRDFQHLRDWRTSMERIRNRTVLTALGVVVTGLIAALWIGLKNLFHLG